ncbi:MAG: CBS domain-containing protein [Anaerolineae bacterium]|nr:CBS domain-containing protein [Anaerolineae bacterium]MDW8097978.1 CBS domain-containing protein [Anaerolineae bacterium]
MTEQDVGSLLVRDASGQFVGLITERQIIRYWSQHPEATATVPVREAMNRNPLVAFPDDDLDYVMSVMTENRVRHVLVLSDGELVGIVSIGDMVKAQLEDTRVENRYLQDFIAAKYIS